MKKRKGYEYFFIAAGTCGVCGGICLLFDWFRYSRTLNSAPFSLWILVNALAFGGAAVACLTIGWVLRKKSKNRKEMTR